MICGYIPPFPHDDEDPCPAEATNLVGGSPRCAEHTPEIRPITADDELALDIEAVAHARSMRGLPRLPARRGRGRFDPSPYGLGDWDPFGDDDYSDGFNS